MSPPTRDSTLGIWYWFGGQYRPSLVYISQSAVLIVIAALLSSCDPLVVRWVIDLGIPSRSMPAIAGACIGFLLLHFGRLACTAHSAARLCVAGQQTVQRIRLSLFRNVLNGGSEFHDQHQAGTLAFTLQQDVDKVTEFGGGALFAILRTMVNTAVIACAMIAIDGRLASCVLALVVPFAFVRRACFARLNRLSELFQEASSQASSAIHEYVGAAHHVFLVNMESFVLRRLASLQRSQAHHERRMVRTENIYGGGSVLIYIAAIPVVLCMGSYQVIHGHLTIGLVMAFYAYLVKLFDPLNAIADIDSRLSHAFASLKRVYRLALIEHTEESRSGELTFYDRRSAALHLSNITFSYRGQAPALRNRTLGNYLTVSCSMADAL
jgi:ATP-binding cassette, subfamily B, bacterial